VSTRERDTTGPSLFVAELVAARTAAGLTQDALAAQINYSPSLIGMIESGRRAPTLDVAERLDKALKAPGTLVRLQQHARTTPLPSWFRPYAEIEATATQLRMWEHAIVPGLLQTEEYARAMLAEEPNITDDELEVLVGARLARQAVLTRESGPPVLWALIDESALCRTVGSPKVMYGQLMYLAHMSDQPNITIQIVPISAGAHCGMSGAFAVADVDGVGGIAYLETVADGYIVERALRSRGSP